MDQIACCFLCANPTGIIVKGKKYPNFLPSGLCFFTCICKRWQLLDLRKLYIRAISAHAKFSPWKSVVESKHFALLNRRVNAEAPVMQRNKTKLIPRQQARETYTSRLQQSQNLSHFLSDKSTSVFGFRYWDHPGPTLAVG